MPPPRIAAVLVNWRGAGDTIECLESLLRSDVPVRAIVCDNDSGDGSVAAILDWAAGKRPPTVPAQPALAHLTDPPLAKPVACERLVNHAFAHGPRTDLTVIETGGNLGYAGGNNVGIRYALADPAIDVVWLLNNDTVVAPETAGAILAAFDADPALGMAGAPIRYYHRPDTHQLLGGMRFDRWTAMSAGVAGGHKVADPIDAAAVLAQTDFVCGASLAVSRAFLDSIGPMEDRYFLYYEEVDWARRNAGRFHMGFVADAIVWHKEGASAGSSGAKGQRSAFSDYHLARSKLIFGRKHDPLLVPLYWAQNMGIVIRRLLRRQPDKARAILRASFGLPFG